jgi:hypothetical protein
MCYLRVLEDPFNNPPCKLGYNTMVPTALATATFRSNIAASSDGSIAICVSPFIGTNDTSNTAGFHYNNSGNSGTVWTHAAWLNAATILPLSTEARVVSVALKAFPIVAATATPPISYCGALVGKSIFTVTGQSPGLMLTSPTLQKFIGVNELMARGRTVDNQAFEFLVNTMSGHATNVFSTSTPAIVINGLPASATISVEATLHIEYVPSTFGSDATTNPQGNQGPDPDNVSTLFGSLEEMYRWIYPKLSHPGVVAAGNFAQRYVADFMQ